MAYGLSQLQSLDERAEGWLVFCEAEAIWSKSLKIRQCSPSELARIKPLGGGGTLLHLAINNYKAHLGEVDFLIIITDGQLLKDDVIKMVDPKIPIYWIITSATAFIAPFGKVYELKE